MDSDEYGYLEQEGKDSSKKKKEEKRSKRSPRSTSRSEQDKREKRDRSPRSTSHSERDKREARDRSRRRSTSRADDRDRERDRSRRSRSRFGRDFDTRESRHFSRRRSTSRADDRERERDRSRRSRSRFGRDFDTSESRRLKDQRTVFAYQIPLTATRRDVCEFFCPKAGEVREVRLITDLSRSKGVGYIEFKDAVSVSMAVALSGKLLLGQPVMVIPYVDVDRTLYVGNLHFYMTERHLREIFEPYGTVEAVQLPLDLQIERHKGFGFIEFANIEQANAALSVNEKLEINGRIIKVSSLEDGCQYIT